MELEVVEIFLDIVKKVDETLRLTIYVIGVLVVRDGEYGL
jgi:hypothetical protein